MTVEELIIALAEIDDQKLTVHFSGDDDFCEISSVSIWPWNVYDAVNPSIVVLK